MRPLPIPTRDAPHEKMGTINMISYGFDSGGEFHSTLKVYAANISMKEALRKKP